MKHEKYSFGYDLLRVYARWLHKLIHRRIVVSGRENIPHDKPLIFAPNHQNALMDAMAVLLIAKQQPTWLARADIFKNKTISKILYFLKISPVYRIRDGKANLEKNDEVFELSIRVLKNRKALAVFPEAQHTFRRQSAAHKKAVPRIAFMAEEREDFKLDIHIVPIGLYYDHYYNFNRELIVSFGEPVRVKDFEAEFRENPGAANISLRKKIYGKLVPQTIHIKSKIRYDEYEQLRDIFKNTFAKSLAPPERIEAEKSIIKLTESFEENNPEEANGFFENLSSYKNLLEKIKINDRTVARKGGFLFTLVKAFAAGFTLPVFLYGWLNFFLPFHLPSILIRKKIKDRVFWATVEYVAWIIFIPVFLLMQWGIVWAMSGDFLLSIIYLLTLPLFGKTALHLNDFYKNLKRELIFYSAGKVKTRLIKLRKNITDIIRKITDD